MRLSHTKNFSLALLSVAIASAAQATTEPTTSPEDFYNLSLAELGQVEISIATGNSTPLDRAPAAATVISASEIQAMGARNLNEALETVPGLHVALSSLSRLDSVYSIRGIHTGFNPQVLLMMNGVPVQYSAQGGRPTLFRLPVNSIDRIEVIRGPGSAIYGADAFSGVINVITKDASAIDATRIGGVTGSFGSRELWLQTASEWQDINIGFNIAYQKSDGDPARVVDADLQSFLDRLLGTNASLAPGALATHYELLDTRIALSHDRWQLNLWNWRSVDAGVGAGGAQALDYSGNDNSNLWLGDFTYHLSPESSQWNNSIRVSYLHYDQESIFTLFPAGAVLPISATGNVDFVDFNGVVQFPDGLIGSPGGLAEDTQLDFISIYEGLDSHRVRVAVGSRYQSLEPRERKNFGPGIIDGTESVVDGMLIDVTGTPNVFMSNSTRTIRYLSLQDEWQLHSSVQLTAGIRHDNYSDFGATTNPRLALVWANNEWLTSKLMYGSAFRAPSFMEQFSINNPVSLGNPNLDPEKINTLELSFNARHAETLSTTITLFEYRAQDMIEFVQDTLATTKTARNARDQNGDGIELELNWKPHPDFYLTTSYSYQDAKDKGTDVAVANAPGQQVKLNTNWEFAPHWYANVQVNWIADRERVGNVNGTNDPRKNVDDYGLVNLTLRREYLLPNLDFSLALKNIANEKALEPSTVEIPGDYPLESRSVWVALEYRFQ